MLCGLGFLALIGILSGVLAQDAQPPAGVISASECAAPLGTLLLAASDACVGKPFGFVCNGGLSPLVEPAGPVSNSLAALGSLVETTVVESIRTASLSPSGDSGGIAWLRVAAPDTFVQYSALIVGDVTVRNVTPPGFPAWQALTVETLDAEIRCESAPHSALILQNLLNRPARVVVNGASLDLRGTVVVQTIGTETRFMTIGGEAGVLVSGQQQTMISGQEVAVPYAAGDWSRPLAGPSAPRLFDADRVENAPVLLLDRPVAVPQAGYAQTDGAVNMRTAPSLDAAVLLQVPAGVRMTVLGRNPAGDWYHVRLPDGQTGWMFASLLSGQIGEIDNVYMATPQPLQRLGELGQTAQVIAPNGVSLRTAPDIAFSPLTTISFGTRVTLMGRSPYSPWVKVDAGGQVGWAPLIAMETRAIIEALPVDYDVPPPPQPTRVPGSFGNAIPDPGCYPNC